MSDRALLEQAALFEALSLREAYDHPVCDIRRVETHISRILLTGYFAYKLKKPLDLGFLDFSTLEKRRHCCEEEVRLNKRLAPDLYLEVVPVVRSHAGVRMGGKGEILDYAVKMRQFPEGCLMDALAARGEIGKDHLDALADRLAQFHTDAARAQAGSPWGEPESLWQPCAENFEQIAALLKSDAEQRRLAEIRAGSEKTWRDLAPLFRARKQDGFIRECHGDLHLRNLIWLDGHAVAFDGIEFNANLHWIDVQSDIAFLYMDLTERKYRGWALRVYNRYLERGGDYAGAAVLDFYAAYRAMVRAKVALIRASQNAEASDYEEGLAYLELAEMPCSPRRPMLIVTHGLSGSGKTTHSQGLLEAMGAIRVRSDVERKRLFGLAAEAKSAGDIYTPAATQATFGRMRDLARDLLRAGWPVIADATFLDRWQRDMFRELAHECGVAFRILDFTAPKNVLEDRVAHRLARGRDASEADLAILHGQMANEELLAADETDWTVTVDTTIKPNYESLASRLLTDID
jgi:uncharacterized protein